MYSKYDEAQFHLRLPHELHAKIKQRAKMNIPFCTLSGKSIS